MSSPNNTYVVGVGATVTDAQGVVFAINSNGQITIYGKVDPTMAGVDALGYANGLVWQKNADNFWYSKTSATARWANYVEVNGVPPMAVPSASSSGIFVTLGVGTVQDTDGNSWAINAGGVVVVDGKADLTTGRVIKLNFVNGVIWQENADGNWYSKVKPSDTWTQATRTAPIVAAQADALTWTGNSTNPTQAAAWRLPNGASHAPVPRESLSMSGGTMNLCGGNLAGNVLHTVPNGTINMTNGSSLKLDAGEPGAWARPPSM